MLPKAKEIKVNQSELLSKLLAVLHRFFFAMAIIVFVAIIISGYLFLIHPKYVVIAEEARAKEEQKTQQLQNLQSYLSRFIQYREKYNKINSVDKGKIDVMIAGKYLPEDVFTEMEKLIAARGLILDSIEVSASPNSGGSGSEQEAATPAGGVGQATIKLRISGVNYEGLKQLLAIIENNLQLLDVKKIDFSPVQNTATLEILSYYLN